MFNSNNGNPRGECALKKGSECCIHAAIVTMHVHGTPGVEAEQHDGVTNGVDYGPEDSSCEEEESDGERDVERGVDVVHPAK